MFGWPAFFGGEGGPLLAGWVHGWLAGFVVGCVGSWLAGCLLSAVYMLMDYLLILRNGFPELYLRSLMNPPDKYWHQLFFILTRPLVAASISRVVQLMCVEQFLHPSVGADYIDHYVYIFTEIIRCLILARHYCEQRSVSPVKEDLKWTTPGTLVNHPIMRRPKDLDPLRGSRWSYPRASSGGNLPLYVRDLTIRSQGRGV